MPDQPATGSCRLRPPERLRGKNTLEELFTKGSSFFIYPFKVKWLPVDNPRKDRGMSVVWVIPKRNIRQANQRNTLRRRCREAYRLNKHIISPLTEGKGIHLALVCIVKEDTSFQKIQKSTVRVLQKINELVPASFK